MPPTRWIRKLNRAICLATRCEAWVTQSLRPTPIRAVAFGTVIRNRRLAHAVSCLRGDANYEARILLRTMLEIYYNYAWIRLKPFIRSNRYLKSIVLEDLNILKEFPVEYREPWHDERMRELKRARARLRYLFQFEEKLKPGAPHTGTRKLKWRKSWTERDIRTRMLDVMEAQSGVRSNDCYLYGMFLWNSSAVHGGMHAFTEVIEPLSRGLRAKSAVQLNEDSSLILAWTMLGYTLNLTALDLRFGHSLRTEVEGLSRDVHGLSLRTVA